MLVRRPKPVAPAPLESLTGAPPPPSSVEAPPFRAADPLVRRPRPPSGAQAQSRVFDGILRPALPSRPAMIRRG